MQKIEDIIAYALNETSFSDIHLANAMSPRFRIDGDLISMNNLAQVNSDDITHFLRAHTHADFGKDKDFAAMSNGRRFRVNCSLSNRGLGLVLRVIPQSLPSYDDLGLPEYVKSVMTKPRGLFLTTGVTGMGKSTTQNTIIDTINRSQTLRINMLEDPIEFVHESLSSLIEQREVGRDTDSFETGIRASMRQDPDIILVGEMRDLATTRAAIAAAESGHMVFATLHSQNATQTMERLANMFPKNERDSLLYSLSNVLIGSLSQVLVKKKTGGRVLATELLVNTSACAAHIRKDQTGQLQNLLQLSSSSGMITLNDSLTRLVMMGVIEQDVAKAVSYAPSLLDF